MAPVTINRHEKLSHFFAPVRKNAGGEILNEKDETLLEALRLVSYWDVADWIVTEFAIRNLAWKELGAGSAYPRALPLVVNFLEDRLQTKIDYFNFCGSFIFYWKQFTSKERRNVFMNFQRVFLRPEILPYNPEFCRSAYARFSGMLKHYGLN